MVQNVEKVVIGQASVQVAVPMLADCDDPVLRQILALGAEGLAQFERAGRLAGTYLLGCVVHQWEKVGGTAESWQIMIQNWRLPVHHQAAEVDHPAVSRVGWVGQFRADHQARRRF